MGKTLKKCITFMTVFMLLLSNQLSMNAAYAEEPSDENTTETTQDSEEEMTSAEKQEPIQEEIQAEETEISLEEEMVDEEEPSQPEEDTETIEDEVSRPEEIPEDEEVTFEVEEESDTISVNNADEVSLVNFINDRSMIQFKYRIGSTNYTVTYGKSIEEGAVGHIELDGDTPITDVNGDDLNLVNLKGIRLLLATSFSDDEIITNETVFTYNLPDVTGTSWDNTNWKNLDTDGVTFATYRVNNNKIEVKFTDDFINLNNRFAIFDIDATVDLTKVENDMKLQYVFEGIGTFIGNLEVPKYLDIVKRDSVVKVDESSDIINVFENYYRKNGTDYYGNNFPYIELTDDGQYLTQILRVIATGAHTNVVVSDYYNYSDNYWNYDGTVGLVKVSADGVVTPLSEGDDYSIQHNSSGRTVGWTLPAGLASGDKLYVAYRTKYNGGVYWSTTVGSTNDLKDPTEANETNIETTKSVATYSREYDRASVKSNESPEKTSYLYNNLYYYGTAKTATNLDTEKKEITWVIYYNLGTVYTKLDNINIKDQASQGQLTLIKDSMNVQFLPVENGQAKYVSSEDVRTNGTTIIEDGIANKDGWETFTDQFMTSNGFKIPEGTGYGSLRVEFKTSYVAAESARGDVNKVTNTSYWRGSYIRGVTIDLGSAGKTYPAMFSKSGEFANRDAETGELKYSRSVTDPTTGLIRWVSTFRLDPAMKLEYRDAIGYSGQRLALDNEEFPFTITFNTGGSGAETKTIEEYKEGASDNTDEIYYILTVYKDVDKKYVTSSGNKDDPDFTVKFVNYDGTEATLPAGNYYVTYYTYYSPTYQYSYSSRSYDVGYYYWYAYDYNYAYLVYNDGKNYMSTTASVYHNDYYKKGSDRSASSYTGDNIEVPSELQPKTAGELFWWFEVPAFTEITEKIVLKDEFNIGGYTNAEGQSHTYNGTNNKSGTAAITAQQKLNPDRFIVYSGDVKLSAYQYMLEETENGFTLTLEKENGYDPTKKLTVYYMTTMPTEKMIQGETYYYGNRMTISAAYDASMKELTGEDTAFYRTYADSYWRNGDYQEYTYKLVEKGYDYDPLTQYIMYSLDINPYEMDLNSNGDTITLVDEMDDNLEYDIDDNGEFIVPIQLYDTEDNLIPPSSYTVDLQKNDDETYGPLTLVVPDGQRMTLKYRVRVKSGIVSVENRIPAGNSVRFVGGDFDGAGDSATVSIVNSGGSAGGTPVYITVTKADTTNMNLLLDDAEYEVTTFNRKKDGQGNLVLEQNGEPEIMSTMDGVFSVKTAAAHVIRVKEVGAPKGYTIDDGEYHYYLVERAIEGDKDYWKEQYTGSGTELDPENHPKENEEDEDWWDTNVELFTSARPKVVFGDTPIVNVTYVYDEFTLSKLDAEDDTVLLENAEFQIYKDAGATVVSLEEVNDEGETIEVPLPTVKTGEDGNVVLSTEEDGVLYDLVPEPDEEVTWYLKETIAPDGYELSESVRSFTISAEKEEGWNEDHTVYEVLITYSITTDDEEKTDKIIVSDDRIRRKEVVDVELTLTKTDAESSEALQGTEFVLYVDEELKEELGTFVTDENGNFKLSSTDTKILEQNLLFEDDLDEGSLHTDFYLKETKATNGYVAEDTVYTVNVTATRTSKWKGEGEERAYVTTTEYEIVVDEDDTLTVTNARNRVSESEWQKFHLAKVDEEQQPLTGAIFTFYTDKDCEEELLAVSAGNVSVKTDDAAFADVLPIFDEGEDEGTKTATIYLKETKAPNGYVENDMVYSVIITAERSTEWTDRDGLLQYVTITVYSMTVDGESTLAVPNEKKRMSQTEHNFFNVVKVNASGKEIENAEFTLYSDEAGTKVLKRFTAGNLSIQTDDEDLKDVLPVFEEGVEDGTLETTIYLQETKAPNGYVKNDEIIPVVIRAERTSYWNDLHTAYVTRTSYTMTANDSTLLNVENKAVPEESAPRKYIEFPKIAVPNTAVGGGRLILFGGITTVVFLGLLLLVKKK